MKCPFCKHHDTGVKDSRSINNGASIKRRRSCPNCNAKFTTFEDVKLKTIKILKKNGSCQSFDQQKLKRSIEVALRKRPFSSNKIDEITDSIVCNLEKMHDAKISTKVVGETVMNALSKIDKVAFIRFASVYMNFSDEDAFISLIKKHKNS